MASKTKKQKALEENIKEKIVDGCKRGVCNREGHSVRRRDGTYGPDITFAQKRAIRGKVTFRKVYPKRWDCSVK